MSHTVKNPDRVWCNQSSPQDWFCEVALEVHLGLAGQPRSHEMVAPRRASPGVVHETDFPTLPSDCRFRDWRLLGLTVRKRMGIVKLANCMFLITLKINWLLLFWGPHRLT